jgi:hypothetical protein
MDRRGPLAATLHPRASTPAGVRTPSGSHSGAGPDTPPPPDMEARPEPAGMATGTGSQAPVMAPPPRHWPVGAMVTFALAVMASAWAWLQRDSITAWIGVHAPNRSRLEGLWLMAEETGTRQLAPILKQLHIGLDPTFVFDLLAVLFVLLVLRNIYASIVRARNRRAYERAQLRRPS